MQEALTRAVRLTSTTGVGKQGLEGLRSSRSELVAWKTIAFSSSRAVLAWHFSS